jgi:hypothetical protein
MPTPGSPRAQIFVSSSLPPGCWERAQELVKGHKTKRIAQRRHKLSLAQPFTFFYLETEDYTLPIDSKFANQYIIIWFVD